MENFGNPLRKTSIELPKAVSLDRWKQTCSIIAHDALVLSETAAIAEEQGLGGHPEVQAELYRKITAMISSLDQFSKNLTN